MKKKEKKTVGEIDDGRMGSLHKEITACFEKNECSEMEVYLMCRAISIQIALRAEIPVEQFLRYCRKAYEQIAKLGLTANKKGGMNNT